ncbi:RDD family protein [Rhizobium sp.]|uniref:RDD family protein n=1 Tax=Rhizobium sp. TaxID=391 RepID=UPI002EF8FE34
MQTFDTSPEMPIVTHTDTSAPAGPWPRWFARMIDWIGFSSILSYLLAYIAERFSPTFYLDLTRASWGLIKWYYVPSFAIAQVFTIVVLASLMAMVGTTPGKAIFGIRVHPLTSGNKFAFYLQREFWVFIKGSAAGIPVIALVTAIIQYNRVKIRLPASYDVGTARVDGTDVSILRGSLGAVSFAAAIYLSTQAGKDTAPGLRQVQDWQNAVTFASAKISRVWAPQGTQLANKLDRALYGFSNPQLGASVTFLTEPCPTDSIDNISYAKVVKTSLSGNLIPVEDWEPFPANGIEALSVHAFKLSSLGIGQFGSLEDNEVIVAAHNGICGQIVISSSGKPVAERSFLRDTAAALISTIQR